MFNIRINKLHRMKIKSDMTFLDLIIFLKFVKDFYI